jgi:hypothetical protein
VSSRINRRVREQNVEGKDETLRFTVEDGGRQVSDVRNQLMAANRKSAA